MNKCEVWADIPRLNGHYQVGNLTKNPESGSTSSGISYSRFTIAVNRRYTDSNGDRKFEL